MPDTFRTLDAHSMPRDQYLNAISEISYHGKITRKLDFIAAISLSDRHSFNVFRRYNSVYEIVVEDYNQDFYFLRDYTIAQTLQRIMCLTDAHAAQLFTIRATSFKNNCELDGELLSHRWSEIHAQWHGVSISVGGTTPFRETAVADEWDDYGEVQMGLRSRVWAGLRGRLSSTL